VALVRMRWAIWGTAALVGLGAGIGLIVLRSSSPAASTPMMGGAATTWAAGEQKAPAFRLRDQSGKPVSLDSYRGRPLIVTFLDPLCRNYCPVEASRLNDVVHSLPPASRPAIVAVSVNVFGNAPRYLVQDMHKWKLGSEFRWGVGTPSQLSSVWKRYDIGVLDQAKKIAGVEVHDIVHTEAAYIVDANGYERALYLWPFTAADVKATLTALRG
jgi:cytochrome oxidase Cu insertion factor (SCO1/SenC/PrrC family)